MKPFLPFAAFVLAASPAAAATIDQVAASLRATRTMTADFTQTDRDGHSVGGTLTLKMPGKARFQYAKGVPLLMVADGKSLWFIDYQVRQVQRWPIGAAPLRVLLDPAADVTRVAKVLPSDEPGLTIVQARDPKHPEFGTVMLAFRDAAAAPSGLRLDGWTVIDAQNRRSVVRLAGQRYGVAVPDGAFAWVDPRPAGRR